MLYINNIVNVKAVKNRGILYRFCHVIKLVIIPHKENDYRPHLIRRYGLAAIFFIVIGIQLGYNSAITGKVLGREPNITINTLLEQTNRERFKAGEKPLKLNDKLDQAAYLKAQDMFLKQYWAHNAPDGTPPWKWLGNVGYNYDEAGENLAKNFTSTDAVMTAWINSPEHRANILKNDYQDVGFAVVDGEMDNQPMSLIVAMYGLSAEHAVATSQKSFLGAMPTKGSSFLTQFAVIIQSLTPAAMVGLAMLVLALIVAIMSHVYRKKIPKSLRKYWYHYHAVYKAFGLIFFGLIIILTYAGGRI